ncbi:prolyl oligopeptidase family serine peptidase [Phenylobacterium sp.]|uniref:prolyl oligopeptidase family serine peptidase n=1 Tax=Phenylobacterium sp. TaxID=1871053 RepID=UPI002731D19F|nr:prolyl oligopeptidase family serine peptidase [Phenylobacterium sp.]MDP1599466.1 prolyl oligopeptidase family serine peptidase [Phenylobacterium sp.]MDP3595323.1 prolyl oligopeptidase family serine peptidase [Phenylobacterium sp.]
MKTILKTAAASALLALLNGCAATPEAAAPANPAKSPAIAWGCPDGYQVKEGLNIDFPHAGEKRAFFVHPAKGVTGPAPVWVPLTGTVESTNANLNVPRSGANALMADKGFTVIGPVRQCANQDPNLGGGACNGVGKDGWNWAPWREGRAPGEAGASWKNDQGPDSTFFEAMIKCVGTKYPLDAKRLYIGGISSGGTMTNRALTFRSDFWAGGMPISGEWYVSNDDGSALSFDAARQAVIDAPAKIHQGRVAPFPLRDELGSMIVITVWGGEMDIWRCGPTLCADYRPSTQAGSNYFSSKKNVVHVACKATHGHMWPQVNTQDFNLWALTLMASHPKGSDPGKFKLTTPPEGYSCKVGRFDDLYPS